MEFLNIQDASEEGFKKIASKLFNDYAIITHDSMYRMLEIEFYWHSSKHQDHSTYDRKHVDPKCGEWFFHYSGVDISLRDEKSNGYGGILLRKICDLESGFTSKGPMVTAMRLFSGTNAFSDTIKTKIIPHSFPKVEPENDKRIGLGKNSLENGANNFRYRFYINISK